MQPNWYPGAWRGQSRSYGTWMSGVEKLLLHTTESTGWPSYPSFAPTLTYDPWRHEWRQHMPILGSASTLSNAGSFQTNRDNVVQVEIIGFADESMGARYDQFIADIDQRAIDDLGAFAAWLHDHYGLQLDSDVTFKAYNDGRHPSSYGYDNGVRLSVSEYDRYRGILGHMHAPGNDHGDPGLLDVDAIIDSARGGAAPPDEPDEPEDEEMTVSGFHHAIGSEQTLAASSTWQTLHVDPESNKGDPHDIVVGPTLVKHGSVYVAVSGLDALDNSVYFQFYTVDKRQGENKIQSTHRQLKFDRSHDGWIRAAFPFPAHWPIGEGDDNTARALRLRWKSDQWRAKVEYVEIDGEENRE